MAARFWVGGAGTWDGSTTTHWAASSGGASGASAPTSADDVTFDSNSGLVANTTVTIGTGGTCHNLTISPPAVRGITFSLGTNLVVTGAVSIISTDQGNRLLFNSTGLGTQRTLTIASITALQDVNFQDIAGAGAAAPFTGTRLGDATGNSGITFTASATQAYAGGVHNWSDVAAWTSRVPLPQDDVTAAGVGGTLTVDMLRVGRSLDFTGFTGTLDFSGAVVSTADFYGNLTWGAGMSFANNNITLRPAGRGATFTITSNGRNALCAFTTFNQGTGKYQLGDDFDNSASNGSFALGTNGVFDANGHNLKTGFYSQTVGSSTVTMGTGTWTMARASVTGWTYTAGTLNVNTSTILLNAASQTFAGGTKTYNNITFTGGGTAVITGAVTCVNLTFTGGAVVTEQLQITSGTLTITGTFTVSGNSPVNGVMVQSSTFGTQKTISAAAVSLTNVDFRDIAATGAAAPWTGTSIGDAQGNSGITFTTPVTRFWVGGTGNWSDTAHWSATSGGAGGASVPICHDTVRIDGNSGAGTITMDMLRLGVVDFTGYTGTFSATTQVWEIYGSLTLASGMTLTTAGAAGLNLRGRGSHTFTSSGKTFACSITVQNAGGTYTLGDDFAQSGSRTLTVGGGTGTSTFTANGKNLALRQFSSLAGGVTNMGSGTWSMGFGGPSEWSVAGGTINAQTSTIVLTATASARTFAGGGATYNVLDYSAAGSTASLTITGSNAFTDFHFKDATNARTLTLAAGTTQTITGTWDVAGSAGKLITINSSAAGTQATISRPATSTTPITDYLSLQDSNVTGGSVWMAGSHSTNVSNNSGWVFGDAIMGVAAMVSASTMSANGVPEILGAAAMTSQSSLSAAGVPEVPAAASLIATSTMFATGSVKAAPRLKHPTAILTGHAAGHRVTIPVPRGNTGTTTPAYG